MASVMRSAAGTEVKGIAGNFKFSLTRSCVDGRNGPSPDPTSPSRRGAVDGHVRHAGPRPGSLASLRTVTVSGRTLTESEPVIGWRP